VAREGLISWSGVFGDLEVGFYGWASSFDGSDTSILEIPFCEMCYFVHRFGLNESSIMSSVYKH